MTLLAVTSSAAPLTPLPSAVLRPYASRDNLLSSGKGGAVKKRLLRRAGPAAARSNSMHDAVGTATCAVVTKAPLGS